MEKIGIYVIVSQLLWSVGSWSATCLTPSHGSFETYTVWFSEFSNGGGGIVGPNGEIPSGGGGQPAVGGEQPTDGGPGPAPSGGGSPVGPNGEIVGPNGEIYIPGPSGGETGGQPPSGGNPITGPNGEIVGPNGEIYLPGSDNGSGGPSPGGGASPSPSDPTGGGVIVGPNGETPGGGVGNPTPGTGGPVPSGGPSGGGGGPTPGVEGPDLYGPYAIYKNDVVTFGRDRVEGSLALVRPLKNVVNGVSDTNFNRAHQAPSFIAVASGRAPGDAKPAPEGQHVLHDDDFTDAGSHRYEQHTTGDAEVQFGARSVAGQIVSGLRFSMAARGTGNEPSATVRPSQSFSTPQRGQKTVVQWNLGDVRSPLGATPGPNERTNRIRLGVVSTGGDDGPIHLCSNEQALISVDLTFENQRPDIALLTLTSNPAGSEETFVPFSGYVDLGDVDGQFGYAEIALELSEWGIGVTLNGDPLLDRELFLDELGFSEIDELGDFFDVFVQGANLGSGAVSFSLDDLLVYSSETIPEPGSAALVLFGTVLCFRHRCRSQTS